jgi:hypothetical protein
MTEDIRELVRPYIPACIDALMSIARDEKASRKDRIQAARAVLERASGDEIGRVLAERLAELRAGAAPEPAKAAL